MRRKGPRAGTSALLAVAVLLAVSASACSSGTDKAAKDGSSKGTRAGKVAGPSPAPLGGLGDLRKVELLTPMTDAGKRPVFRWKAVPKATLYSLVLRDESGEPYWAWMGPGTSVPLGGGPKPLPNGVEGPLLRGKMSWSVVALDAARAPIAASDLRPVSP